MRTLGHSPVFLAFGGLGISKIRGTGQLPQAGRIVCEREVRVLMLSRPDACKPLALAKKGPGNPEPLLSTQPAPRQLFASRSGVRFTARPASPSRSLPKA